MTVFPRLIFLGAFLTAVALLPAFAAPAQAAAPSGLTATAGDTQVTLTWNDPGDSTITGYQVLSVGISKLVVPDTATDPIGDDDRFGDAVGVDNRRAAVGAPFQDTGGESNVGQVHMFSRGSGGWSHVTQRAFIAASADDNTGASVAVDGRTVVAGVPAYDYPESNSVTHSEIGRMIIYHNNSGSDWAYTEDPRGEAARDEFGTSVSVDGGIAVVGAPYTDVLTPSVKVSVGTAYVYARDSSDVTDNWSKEGTLTASDGAANDRFGTAVAVDANTVVVGAAGDNTNRGAAYVFTKNSGGNWVESAKLTAPGAANDDAFGFTVAVDGDFIVVGARGDDDGGSQSGSVFVFTKPNTTDGWGDWDGLSSTAKDALTAKLTASDAAMNDRLGWSVAVDGDTVLTGAYWEDAKGANSGSVYLFTKPNGSWVDANETVKLTAPDGTAGDEFGYSVAAGGGTAIVGAPGDASETGAAYVFSIPEWTDISVSDDGATISHTATGLDNGVEHTFLIRPVVGSNPEPASGSVKAMPQQSPAATPTGLSALGGDAQVTLSWNDPNDSSITGYEYQQKESGTFGSWITILTSGYGEANSTGYTVTTGVDNGKTYTFRIRAVDEAGDSTASNQDSASTLPAAPATLMAAASDGQVTLSWDDPGNASITKYQYSTDGGTNYTDIALADIDSTSDPGTMKYTVTALVNGRTYTFTLRAVNSTGNGGESALTVAMVPPAPTGLTATGGDGRVALSWNDPNDNGITGYQYSADGGVNYTDIALTAIDSSETGKSKYTIEGLTNGVTYNLALRAVNASGKGGVATATALMVPAAPVNLAAMPLDMQVQLSWDDPANTTITKYELLQLAEESELIASDAAKNDRFGVSVAVDDDTAVVGAFQPDYVDSGTNVSRPGAAYVYTKDSNDAWSQQAKLTASDGAGADEFGISVAVGGDTVVVGARGDETDQGAIYVFTKPTNGDWTSTITETKLTATLGAADDLFGASVALYGGTIVVGAPGAGSAYVFTKNSGVWSQAANLTASNAETGDEFGISVAVDDDTIAVGAYGKDGDSLADSGLVYVFVKPEADGGWANASTETVQLRASDRAANDNFGRSVAVGSSTIVVGASGDRNTIGGAEVSTGSAYAFTEPDTGWANSAGTETAKLTASDGAHTDQFGRSVAVDGGTIMVGAHQNDDDGLDSGSIYVFIKPTNGWTDTTGTVKLTASDGKAGDRFGIALALDGDTALVAAPRNDANDDDDDTGNDVLDAGSAYVIGTSGWAKIPDDDAGDRYHEVTGLTNDITHMFAVRAVNPSGVGPAATVTGVPMPVPAAPAELSAAPSDGQVALTWDDPGDVTITKYQYSTDYFINGGGMGNNGGASFNDIALTALTAIDENTSGYTVTGLANGVTHTLALRAVNDFGAGMPSTVGALMVPAAPELSAVAGDGEVALSWADPGNGTINSYQLWQVGEFIGLQPSDGTTDDFFGHSVAVDGDTAVIGAPQDAKEPGLVYVFTRNSSGAWSQQGILTTTGGSDFSFFGSSVAVHGDTAVVGAPKDSYGNGVKTGAVYVFTRDSSGAWSQQARLTASDGGLNDEFGISVAVDGDTVVVGAWKTGKGAAYVFTRNDGVWDGGVNLTASDGKEDDEFGISVALNGKTLVVGAPRNDKYIGNNINEEDAGAAYVFTKPTGGWGAWDDLPQTDDDDEDKDGLTAKLTASDRAEDDFFGQSVALDDDTILVGAPGDNNNDNDINSGSVYLFAMPSDGWGDLTEDQKLTASDGAVEDMFGNSVTLDGDTAVVGAYRPTYTNFSKEVISRPGATYVFTRDSSDMWRQAARMTASDSADGDQFGYSVAMDGSSVFIGAYKEVGAVGSGSVYTTNTTNWLDISGSDATTTSHNVAGLTNYQEYWFRIRAINQTGAGPASNSASATPRIGKPGKPTGLSAQGGDKKVALRWDNPNDSTNDSTIDKYQISESVPEDWLTASDGAAGDQFGVSVAVDGDIAVVGAYHGDFTVSSDSGAAYIFTRSAGVWSLAAKLTASDGAADDQFGWSVAVDGDTIVVGAYRDDHNGLTQPGSAYVFVKPSAGWADDTETVKLTAPDATDDDLFGVSVAVDGDTVVVGAPFQNYVPEDPNLKTLIFVGSVYVFTTPDTTNGWEDWDGLTDTEEASLTAKLTTPTTPVNTRLPNDLFGSSVAVDGDTILIGSFLSDGGFERDGHGRAYLFTKPGDAWVDTSDYTTRLTASDGAPGDWFGYSAALDGATAVIGARLHNDPTAGAGSGAAYVFTRESGVWGEKARLTASDGAAQDNLGFSVAVDGDNVVVGAWLDGDNGSRSGSAYVFTKPALGWVSSNETLKLTAPDGAANDRFGSSVAVEGKQAFVGAYKDDIGTVVDAGSIHVLGIPDWEDIFDSGDDTTTYDVTTVPEPDPDATKTPLNNGTEYSFQIRALNRSGAGPASDGVSATPLGAPAKPALSATAGDAQVTLSWNAATEDATKAPITHYEYSTDGGMNFIIIPGSDASTAKYTVTNQSNGDPLSNATIYTIAVQAVNAIGATASDTDDATPASATPAAPQNLAANPGDTQVELTWDDPDDISIDHYEYRWKQGTIDSTNVYSEWADITGVGPINYAYTQTDLTNDDAYTFQVRAVDLGALAKESIPSSDTATPLSATPGIPGDLKANAGDKAVRLIWDDPNDVSIDKYQYSTDDGVTNFVDIPGSGASTTEFIVTKTSVADSTDLINGVQYTFQVRAVDQEASTREGAPGVVVATPLPDEPKKPDDLTAIAGDGKVTLQWRMPADTPLENIDYYEVRRVLRESELIASGSSADDRFGYAVAVDGNTAVVGAYQDDGNGVDSGAAYVFSRVNEKWTAPAKLTASDGAAYDQFGISVAVDGDTVVIGASGDDRDAAPDGVNAGAVDSGSAYVFVRPTGGWTSGTETGKLTPDDGEALDYFGYSVAVSGNTVLVGAYQDDDEDGDLEDSGSAYVFVEPAEGWVDTTAQTAKLTAPDAAGDDYFGTSVALDGDTAVIGAPGDDAEGIDSGSVSVFTKPNGGWGVWDELSQTDANAAEDKEGLTAQLPNTDSEAGDSFGYSVAVNGNSIAVGAYQHDPVDPDSDTNSPSYLLDAGAAYVFTGDSSGWSQQQQLTAEDGAAFDYFGFSVSVDANTVLVGAYGDDDNGSDSGSAYVFTRDPDSGVWSQTNKLTEEGGEAGGRFGHAVAVNEVTHTALVGAGSAHVSDIHDWEKIPNSDAATTSHIVSGLFLDVTYEFQVRAVNLAGAGGEAKAKAELRAPQGGNNEAGVVSLSTTQPVVNVELTASLADPDDPVTSVSWRWSKSSDGTTGWSDIPGANSNRYIPIAADVDNYLRASASYTDAFGPGQPAAAVSAARVQSAQVGNNDPYFIDDTLTLTVAENTPVGQNVGRAVTATDPDHDTLTYSLSGTDVAYFDIAPATGQITVGSGATLNYESGATSYTVIVSVHDGSPDSAIDDSIDVTINVTDANDAPEAVTDTLNINENSGATHLNVIANDNDEDGDTLSINVVNGAAVISTPSKGTAVVKAGSTAEITYTPNSTATGPDTFTYEVSDGNGGTDVGTVNVTITPLPSGSDDDPPVNDSPRFNEGASVTRTVAEDAAVGTEVGDPVTARDRNNDRLEYSLSGTDRASFDIDRSTGQLITSTLLDYEVQNEYSVRVQVEDGQGGVAGIDATITVMDVDEPPAQPEAPEVRSAGLTSLAVGWTAPDNQGPEITDYDVRYREVGGEFQDAGYSGIGTSWALNDLSPTTGYEVQVRAINAEGISLWSESGRGETGQALSTPAPTPVLEITPTPDPAQAGTPTSTPGPGDASARTPTPAVGLIGTPAPAQTPGPVVAPATVPATPPAAVGTVPTPTATQAPSASVPEPTTALPPAAPAEPDSGRGFPVWLIAAIIVAGLLAIVLGYLGVRMLRR